MFGFPPHPLTRLRLADGVRRSLSDGRAQVVVRDQTLLSLDDPVALQLLAALDAGPAPGAPGAPVEALAQAERQLLAAGVLTLEFLATPGGDVVAAFTASGYAQPLREGVPAADWRLHRHAVLRPDADGWRLSHALSNYQLWLAHAGLLDGVRERSEAGGDALAPLLAQALWAGALAEDPRHGDPATAAWSHEDLLFHAASRRHADHRPRGKRKTRPAWAPPPPPLAPSAVLEQGLRQRLQSMSFESVLAARRSVRGTLPAPTREALRDLLRVLQAERGGQPTAPGRAYPTAGGVQALEFHLAIAASADTAAALFRFDAVSGELQPLASPAGSVQRLLDEAAIAWGEHHGQPRALVVITAHVPELAARYEATAYRLALLEAGGAALLLAQAAAALGLGACCLGNGDSTLFAWASGRSEWQFPAIAEVAIAGRLGA